MMKEVLQTIIIPSDTRASAFKINIKSIHYEMILKQLIKFTGVGVFGTAVQYVTLFLLVQIADIHPVVASTAGFMLGAFVNYHLNYIYTFRSSKSHFEAMPKFFSVAAVGLFLNGVIMQFFIGYFSIAYIFAQLIATGLVLLWNFTANRMWTFMETNT
jgi:putative flippase GtrA